MINCIYARDTGNPWGACECTAVECHCTERLDQLRGKVLRDTVDYHTRFGRADDPYGLGYLLVRSKFCNSEKCSFHTTNASPGT